MTLLVDLQALDDAMDVRADENGVWNHKGSPVAYYISVHKNRGSTADYKYSHVGSHSHHYKITRAYYHHSSSPVFTKIITSVKGGLIIEYVT